MFINIGHILISTLVQLVWVDCVSCKCSSVKEASSVLMLWTPNNSQQSFLYHTKIAEFFFDINSEKFIEYDVVARARWINHNVGAAGVFNINTGAHSINTERAWSLPNPECLFHPSFCWNLKKSWPICVLRVPVSSVKHVNHLRVLRPWICTEIDLHRHPYEYWPKTTARRETCVKLLNLHRLDTKLMLSSSWSQVIY